MPEQDTNPPAPKEGYKSPSEVSPRQIELNALAATLIQEVPKEHRVAMNGPVRKLVALHDKVDGATNETPAPVDTFQPKALAQVKEAVEAESPKEALVATIESIQAELKELNVAKNKALNPPKPKEVEQESPDR
jgi:hypothetical protein